MALFRRKPTINPGGDKSASDIPARLALAAIGAVEAGYAHTVTYAVSDLDFVDQALSDLAAAGDIASRTQTIAAFGCLFGEILVKNDGGRWEQFSQRDAAAAGFPFGVLLPNGRMLNVVSIAYKRAIAGPERSLIAIRDMALSESPPAVPVGQPD